MSRWSKRSKEEKERIYQEQKELREPTPRVTTLSLSPDSEDNKQYREVLERHEIPLQCFKHGWVSSANYELINDDGGVLSSVLKDKAMCIRGKCPKCGNELKRYITAAMVVQDAGVTMLLIDKLKKEGRLKDLR